MPSPFEPYLCPLARRKTTVFVPIQWQSYFGGEHGQCYCGFTPQYKGLESVYSKYKDRGLVVLGFPSNDFAQEKTNNQEIADFCENTFGVKFPMFTKTSVTGDAAVPFFKQLAKDPGQKPKWNFYKYLIGRDGKLIDSYSSMTSPESKSLVQAIEKSLAMKAP
jgi:glutathione peroxidase